MGAERQSVEIEAESLDVAISEALGVLGLAREAAEVEVLQEARRAVLGFGGQSARVRVSARAAVSATTESASDGASDILRRLLALMDVEGEVSAVPADEPGNTWLKISSSAGGLLIGRHGQTLDALEYIVNRLAGRDEVRFLVDAEGYRERRSHELREVAERLAERVRRTSRPQTMDPLAARERRIVHLALREDPTVTTESIGEGSLRRVVIQPSAAAKRGPAPSG